MVEMVRIIRVEQPTIVHCVSLPLAILGGLAARVTQRRHVVLAVTGLGFAWIEHGAISALLRATARLVIRVLLWHRGTVCVFENSEDPREFGLDPVGTNVCIVGGGAAPLAAWGGRP